MGVGVDLPLPASEEEPSCDPAVAPGDFAVEAGGPRVLEQPRECDALDELGERVAEAGLVGPVGARCGGHAGQGTRGAMAERAGDGC